MVTDTKIEHVPELLQCLNALEFYSWTLVNQPFLKY